jgi:hypothetical protein
MSDDGAKYATLMVTCAVDGMVPALVAVIVYTVAALMVAGIPEIRPSVVLNTKPLGNDGVIENVYGPVPEIDPTVIGVIATPSTNTADDTDILNDDGIASHVIESLAIV